ncbi:MAG: uroporphyrinogen decarboxylase family protein [Anaerolineae bacterium]
MPSLSPRTRLEITLNHQEPDHVPIDLGSIVTGITTGANDALKQHLGIISDDPVVDRIQQLALPCPQLLERLHVDTRYIYLSASRDWHDIELPGNSYQDEFGVRRTAAFHPETGRLLYYDFAREDAHPLARAETVADIAAFKWPDPHDPARYAGLEEKARQLYETTDYAIIVNAIGSIFEFSWYLRGYMQFFEDLLLRPEMVEALLDAMLEFQSALFDEILSRVGAYVSVVMTGSDLGTQAGPAISERVYRELVWPRYVKFWQRIRGKTNAKIFYHSCGGIEPMIKYLIEGGVDILHPVQPLACGMGDRKQLKREYGRHITFWGGFDQQRILPFGTPEQVREEAKRLLEDFMPGGGFVFCAGHNIQTGVPPENVLALFDTVYEYGRYH